MPRKKTLDSESLPPDKTIIEAEHTIKYRKPTIVDADPGDEADHEEFELDAQPAKRKKQTFKEEREKLRSELAKNNITPGSNLRVHIWKYDSENDPVSGGAAEKSFCYKFMTTKDGLNNGLHLDHAQRYGPGRYWFMLYMDNKLVTSWEERVSGPSMATMGTMQQNGQQVFTDPNNPNVTIQMPANGQPADPVKQMRESFKMMKEFREAMGLPDPMQQQQNFQPQLSPEQQLASTLLIDPDIKKKAVRSLLGSNEGEKDLLAMAIEHGPDLIRAAGEAIRAIILDIKRGNGNGTTQMASPNIQNGGQIDNGRQVLRQDGQIQAIQESNNGQALEGNHEGLPQAPEEQLFAKVLNHCRRQTPVSLVADDVIEFANKVESNHPAMTPDGRVIMSPDGQAFYPYPQDSSVWPYIKWFAESETETALAFVAQSEAGKQIAEMPHAKEWCAALQAELKPAIQEGEQENG